jgi:hypothetical protein
MRIFRISLLGLALAQAHLAMGRTVFNGQVHDPGPVKEKIIFTISQEATDGDGQLTKVTTFKDPSGGVALIESTEIVKSASGEKLKKFTIDQPQTQAKGSVEIKDGKAYFKFSENGKEKTSDEKVKGNFIVGPMIGTLLNDHWTEIMAGKTIPARFAVLERQESVGFDFFKEKETELNGQKVVIVKMKPSSFVIAAIVDPLHFYVAADSRLIVQIDGRTTVKRLVNGKYRDLDTLVTYQYPAVTAESK